MGDNGWHRWIAGVGTLVWQAQDTWSRENKRERERKREREKCAVWNKDKNLIYLRIPSMRQH
jgi:hypothetical protein